MVLSILPQVIVDSMVLGFVYAMIALGYTMVYGVLEFINFAHSEIFMIGAVVGAEVLISLSEAKALENFNPLLLILLIIAAGMAVSGLVAVVVERVAYRPLRNAPRLVPLISAIGVSFFLQDLVRMLESIWRNAFYRTYPDVPSFSQRISFGDTLDVSYKSIIVVVAAIVMLLALNYLVGATKIGKSIRAVAQNRATASLMGIDVDRAIALTFLVGGALGGAAGVLYGLRFSTINPYTGFIPGIKAFTAAVLGGIGNITGAMLGGIVLGFLETFGASYLSIFTEGAFGAEYKDILAFGILIIVLIFRPKGLLGEVVGERA
ncbi:MAG: branched-chain amino acid ABC transporter permease [Chloroflexi bacterium]|nr:branched-chain amino acid ABC transporter permease [Chloroflexota bacterium]